MSMSVEPSPNRLSRQMPPPGWYPDTQMPGVQRYWTGETWTADVAPLTPQPVAVQPVPASVVVNVVQQGGPAGRPRAISGLSSGMRAVHLTLTICTLGMWAPVWWLHSRMSRRKILY